MTVIVNKSYKSDPCFVLCLPSPHIRCSVLVMRRIRKYYGAFTPAHLSTIWQYSNQDKFKPYP